jgi:hypothetical protein
MSENLCGSCTMCCKIMGVEEISKPVDTWCASCDKGQGCRVYDTRPTSCREFECVWLWTQKNAAAQGEEPMHEALRPDRSKVVIDFSTDLTTMVVHVDPAFPAAYREGPMGAFLRHAADMHPVLVRIGSQRRALGEPAAIERLVKGRTEKQRLKEGA